MRRSSKRRRGVVLTSQGLQKLQQAKVEAEAQENAGHRYTLEDLSERTGLSVDTLIKVFAYETAVDKQTLKSCFKSFNLALEASDYRWPEVNQEIEPEGESIAELELPGGQVPLNSLLYLNRYSNQTSIETECFKAIEQPGALVRIKAPRYMGKTSLLSRILEHGSTQNYCTIFISLQLADKAIFQDLDRFLRWLCTNVGLGLGLPNQLPDYWDELFGSKVSCSIYFEQYLLAQKPEPIVLAFDDVDRLFQYPELADEFFGLLRTWHEQAKNRSIWQRLRLAIAHAMEVYLPLNVNKSPFNVGLPIELRPFTAEQVQDLAQRQNLKISTSEVKQLIDLVGGHPYLTRLTLYQVKRQTVPLEQVLQQPLAPDSIFSDYLQRQFWHLHQDPDLAAALAQVVASEPIELDLYQAFKLQSMGLIELRNNLASFSNQLYATYFRDRFRDRFKS